MSAQEVFAQGILGNTTGAESVRMVNLTDGRSSRDKYTQQAHYHLKGSQGQLKSGRSLNQQGRAEAIGKPMADYRREMTGV